MSEYCNNFVFHDDTSDTFQSWQGLRGPYFTPYVDEHGNLSWTNNGGLPNPATVNIAGQGIMLKGSCATTGDLPADPENGDAWAVGASEPFECYAWLGGTWVDLGLLFPKGDPGEGVSSGGTTGQILKKASNTDYDTAWSDPDQADWNEADNTKPDYIKNKPSIPAIDNTLSTAGQAADAKAAGDGIKEAEQIVSYVENGAAASRNYTAGEYITWKGVAYYAKTNISSGASFVVDTNLTAVGNQGYTNHLKNTIPNLPTSNTVNVTVNTNLLKNGSVGNAVLYSKVFVVSFYVRANVALSRGDTLITFDLPSNFVANFFTRVNVGSESYGFNLRSNAKILEADGSIPKDAEILGQVVGIIW